MPIVALPQTTVRAIGSTSVISDPCSVVKELMDNAIDSSASSLQIEISQNTVDVIQLKDNGHGIPIDDHANICKHAFTSKIETVDDLKNVGGNSFGFRGEALASIAEMSGGVTITTRTATEVTATCLKYGRDGTLTSSTRTSHPVGTTVRITDFLKYIPVRRQTSLNVSSKTLTKLKRLVQAYAFAQLSRRFLLKVLKPKNESNNWMYAPSTESTLADASLKIAGRDVATCCILKECSSDCPQDADGGKQNKYELVALLPNEVPDIPKVNNVGQYVSIDGRPLSVSIGTGETITKLFKSYVRAAASKAEIAQKVIEPFCCLQLKCPQGAYDVNVEPGKDDVLFGDRDTVFGLIEKLFIAQYGPLLDRQEQSPAKQRTSTNGKPDRNDQFEVLLSRRRPEKPLQSQDVGTDCEESTLASPITQRATTRPVSLSPESSRSRVVEQNTEVDTSSSTDRESRYINPWSISRVNASFQTPHRPRNTHSNPQITSIDTPETAQRREPSHRLAYHSSPESPELLSPPASARPRGSLPGYRITSRISRGSPPEVHYSANCSRRDARERDKERYGNGSLDTWFQRTTGALLRQESVESPTEQRENTPSLSVLAQERFQDPPISEVGAAAADILSFESSNRTSDKESAPAFGREMHAALSPHAGIEESMDSGRGFPVLERWAASLHTNFDPDNQPDLDKALDFERRKKEANQRHRSRPDTVDHHVDASERSGSSPHRNRYLAAKAALNAEQPVAKETMSRPAISPHDPRAYWMRYQTDGQECERVKNGSHLRRLHSNKLPFERIPEGCDIHDISLSLPANLSLISITSRLIPHDSFTQLGMSTDAFLTTNMDSMLPFWNRRLAALIQQHFKMDDRLQPPEWQVDLAPIMARHAAHFNLS